jgi:hypothetical protein
VPLERHLSRFHRDQAPRPPGRIELAVTALRQREFAMLDIVMLTIALGFFALSVGYAHACDEL